MTSFSIIKGRKNIKYINNNALNFSITEPTSIKKTLNYYSSPVIIQESKIDAQLDNPSDIEQVYTFGQSIPNRWVAVGYGINNTIAYSSDGITWNGLGTSVFPSGSGRAEDVAWNGKMWIAVGGGDTNTIAYSYDGITWTGLGKNIFTVWGYGIAWNGKMWVAVGEGEGTYTIAYSYDGINWMGVANSATIFNNGYGLDVSWNGKMWIVTGYASNNTLAYSYDGITWLGLGKSTFTVVGRKVAWNGSMWVGVGTGTHTIAYSYDGINWNGLGKSIITKNGSGIAWNGTLWVATGRYDGSLTPKNNIAYSYDGITWTGLGNFTPSFVYDVQWNGTRFVAGLDTAGGLVTNNSILYSSNGINWRQAPSSFSIFGNGVVTSVAFNNARPNRIVFPPNQKMGNLFITGPITLNEYGSGLSNRLDVSADNYYNTGFNNMTMKIRF